MHQPPAEFRAHHGSPDPAPELLYDEAACDRHAYAFLGKPATDLHMTISAAGHELKRSTKSSSPSLLIKVTFRGTNADPDQILFAHHFTTYFHPINPGFRVRARQIINHGPRFQRRVTATKITELEAFLEAGDSVKPGEHWIRFVFWNLAGMQAYRLSEAIKIRVVE